MVFILVKSVLTFCFTMRVAVTLTGIAPPDLVCFACPYWPLVWLAACHSAAEI
jgi:hypothetical protein